MSKDERTYIKLHDGMPDHPKIDGLSDAAFRLLITSWCWSSRHLTDGRIPEPTWLKRGSGRSRAELLAAGLVEKMPDGKYHLHDYLEHQRSADEVAALREKRRLAGSKGGKAKANAVALAKQTGSKVVAESEEVLRTSQTETDSSSAMPPRLDIEALCKRLADRIEANGSKRPEITDRWRTACRLLLDKDGRTVAQVENCIDWCQTDEFWRANVLSMPTLREKYDQLRLAAQRPKTDLERREISAQSKILERALDPLASMR